MGLLLNDIEIWLAIILALLMKLLQINREFERNSLQFVRCRCMASDRINDDVIVDIDG